MEFHTESNINRSPESTFYRQFSNFTPDYTDLTSVI